MGIKDRIHGVGTISRCGAAREPPSRARQRQWGLAITDVHGNRVHRHRNHAIIAQAAANCASGRIGVRYVAEVSPKPTRPPRPRYVRGIWIEFGRERRSDGDHQNPNDYDTAAVGFRSRRSVGLAHQCTECPFLNNIECSAPIARGKPRCIRPPAIDYTGPGPSHARRRSPCRSLDNDQAGPRRVSGLCASRVARSEQ